MPNRPYKYKCLSHCDESEYDVMSDWSSLNARYIAEDAAAPDYWSSHDGWDSSWPLDFEIFCEGVSLGVFTVEQEAEPTFSAKEKT